MLEEYFIKPSTIDRLRSSWIAPEIEAYVVWLANEGFSTKCVWRRVPICLPTSRPSWPSASPSTTDGTARRG
jgi:hypothetical protein